MGGCGPVRTQPHPTTLSRHQLDPADGSDRRLAAAYVVRRDTESDGTLPG
jgi:hypothetical protein